MAKKKPEVTAAKRERAFLASVIIKGSDQLLTIEDSLLELNQLADTAGLSMVGQITQQLNRPNSATLMGSGKVYELKSLLEETLADVVIFDEELNPRHQRELEKIFGEKIRVLDRSSLILDIFAQHAKTKEGMLQVELAQYEYYLPRLTGAWTHFVRQAGGGGGRAGSVGGVGLRGPGETQLEIDRRSIKKRIGFLKEEIEKVRKHRERYRLNRKKSLIPNIILIGYTNSGKSTLINKLSGSSVYVADQLFATLDPTTRKIELPGGYQALLTDTVGFIQKLPTTLIAAFQATLEELSEADLLLNVIDVSHPNAHEHSKSVHQTLEELNCSLIPIITVLNKIDNLQNYSMKDNSISDKENTVAISAKTGEGIPDLLEMISKKLFELMVPIKVKLPYDQGHLIALFHKSGQVEHVNSGRKSIQIIGRIPGRFLAQYQNWRTDSPSIHLNNSDIDEELQ